MQHRCRQKPVLAVAASLPGEKSRARAAASERTQTVQMRYASLIMYTSKLASSISSKREEGVRESSASLYTQRARERESRLYDLFSMTVSIDFSQCSKWNSLMSEREREYRTFETSKSARTDQMQTRARIFQPRGYISKLSREFGESRFWKQFREESWTLGERPTGCFL